MTDLTEGYAALLEAAPGYQKASSYYDGSVPEVFGSQRLRNRLQKQGEKYRMNIIRSVVNAVADRLEIVSTTVAKNERATACVAEVWKSNALLFEMPNILHRVSELGDAYVMVWPGSEEEADESVVVNYISPLAMRAVYDTDNPRLMKYAVHAWSVKDATSTERWRVNLLYADRIERWITKAGGKPEDVSGWEENPADPEDPESWAVENPYGRVPVFHYRNATPYGNPEHLHGYGAQDAVTKIVVSHLSTIDFHVAPQRYALTEPGNTDDDFDLDDDDDFDTDTEQTTVGKDANASGVKSGPGQVWWLENVKSVGEFSAASWANFGDPMSRYIKMIGQTTDTPLHIVDESGDEPSGESRRRKEGPLTKKVRDRQQMYAATTAEMLAFAVKVAIGEEVDVDVRFAPAEVVADAEGWATIKTKLEAGVPVRKALLEAGYTVEEVDAWYPEGEENTMRVADLVAVADILQKLGAAVALDIISAEEARAMLPEGVLPEGAPAPPRDAPAPPTTV